MSKHTLEDRMDKVDVKRWNSMEEEELAKVLHSYAHLINEAYSYDEDTGLTIDDLWDSILSCIPNRILSTILK
jgi:hypothetical protein